ncbi:MAG: zf-HC2 domain-containing protein [Ignavibacteriales bacterium]|nr:MAG: zf-HC2 domain-containing protein [Ignavibacteriales bacterium]
MKCNLIEREKFISGYLSGDLDEADLLKFEEHYFQCAECFNELKAAEQAVTIIRTEGIPDSKIKMKNQNPVMAIFTEIFSSPVRIGFAAAVIIMAFFLYFALNSSDNLKRENELVISKDSLLIKSDTSHSIPENEDELLADLSAPEFRLNPYLEEWMKDNVRSDENIIKVVTSPANNEKIIDSAVTFRWEMNEKNDIDITVMNNLERTIFSAPIKHDHFPSYEVTVNSKYFLSPGLYYWKLEDENEVLYLGKFYFLLSKNSK